MGHAEVQAQGSITLLAALLGALDPRTWDAAVYLALIAGLLLLRFVVPWPDAGWARFAEEVCLILPAGLFYFFVRGRVGAETETAVANAHEVISLERDLGIFFEPQLQEAILDHHWLVVLMSWIYIWAHWPVILVWALWMWVRRRAAYPVYRNAFLISGVAGMTISALYPVAPPRLLPDLGFVDTVTLHSPAYRVLQPPALTNPYAAMPSLHFGWNFLVGVALVRYARAPAGRLLGVVLPILMFAAIVLTANHFLLDGVIGVALVLAGLAIAAALARRGERPRRTVDDRVERLRPRAAVNGSKGRSGLGAHSPYPNAD